MNHKLALICFILLVAVTASAQRSPNPPPAAAAKPLSARLLVQGTYEEDFQGTTSNGNAQGKLVIKFEAARWVKLQTDEVGNAEVSNLENAPAANVSGSVSYDGRVGGPGSSSGDSYQASSSFAGPLSGADVVLSLPEYTANGFKIKLLINPKLKGKCSLVEVRNGETATSSDCQNGTYFFTASSPVESDDNDEPGKTADTASVASFGVELDIEPEAGAAGGGPAGEANVYAWRGAVTSGSQETGFKILLTKTREQASDDQHGKSVRKLNLTATIVPGAPR